MLRNLQIGKRLNKVLMVSLFSVMIPVGQAMAQDPGDGGLGDPDGTSVPLDGGLSILLAAGAGLGARRAYLSKKKKAKEDKMNADNIA